MSQTFDSFILFAEMRTGSNFLEENLRKIAGITMWGEAFNVQFMGRAGQSQMAGIDIADRNEDPARLLRAMRDRSDGIAGFRFFHDHDARVFERCIDDPRCAKIVLTRNPLDSYVSLKIARSTGQWRLGDMKQARTAQVTFDADEFAGHLDQTGAFRAEVERRLQVSGQTAFHISYDQIQDVAVLNGIAAYLGVAGRIDRPSDRTKVQNPGTMRDKVANYDEMQAALARLDPFALGRMPDFEPRRGPAVPGHVAAREAPVLYMPVRGTDRDRVETWLAALDSTSRDDLRRGLSQKDLRQWKRRHPGHRSFTVIGHPVDRLHRAFCRHILSTGPESFGEMREVLRLQYGLPIPEGAPGAGWDAAAHRAAFLAFAGFVRGNIAGQTSLRVDPSWASQSAVLQGMAEVLLPDMVLREDSLPTGLDQLAQAAGIAAAPPAPPRTEEGPIPLGQIYDDEVEGIVRGIYQRDYMMFGFRARG